MTSNKKIDPAQEIKAPAPKLETAKSAGVIRKEVKKVPLPKPAQKPDVVKVPPVSKHPSSTSNDAQFTAFSNTIYDQVGLGRLIDQLNLIERSLFKDEEGTISSKARDYLSGNLITIFQDIEKAGLEPQEDQKQLQFLKDLTKYLLALPVVKVTVAFEPTHSYVMKLNNQISASVGKKVILEMIIDENVIGGAVFEYNGKMSEQTLKNKLQESLVGLVEKAYAKKLKTN